MPKGSTVSFARDAHMFPCVTLLRAMQTLCQANGIFRSLGAHFVPCVTLLRAMQHFVPCVTISNGIFRSLGAHFVPCVTLLRDMQTLCQAATLTVAMVRWRGAVARRWCSGAGHPTAARQRHARWRG